ncbi:hypothetical protein CFB89_20595 [Burkholderia sp. AU16741]|nr:hypothetical protein CFB89_20595 [Burkholderia sp. AU16741]
MLGDQAGGPRALAEAARVLDGTPYRFRWANFQGAAPLFEAQRARAIECPCERRRHVREPRPDAAPARRHDAAPCAHGGGRPSGPLHVPPNGCIVSVGQRRHRCAGIRRRTPAGTAHPRVRPVPGGPRCRSTPIRPLVP